MQNTATKSYPALRVILVELKGRVRLDPGHHTRGEEAGGRLHVFEAFLLVEQRRQLDPRDEAEGKRGVGIVMQQYVLYIGKFTWARGYQSMTLRKVKRETIRKKKENRGKLQI
jgi:hypothetical protein